MPQSSPLTTRQTAQRRASKLIWSAVTKIQPFGHNHKHYIWRGVNKVYDEMVVLEPSNMTINQNTRPSLPVTGYSRKERVAGVAISVSWPQYHWGTLGRLPKNLQGLEAFCQEEWAALLSEKIRCLIQNYQKDFKLSMMLKGAIHSIRN